ncbi:hypothetical protein AVEN_35155-1 [Araneus ventricosus]|uniref:C2H2-type domain-containing protein n=1 Tax=Araneus ventricosus TaxID=182803 RepID=A0A4Y2HC39_ARAVE|nr:hypothetical protein AVEN_35155-1 [Araneus ventricosus]
MPFNTQSVKRDINGDFKSVQKHGSSEEASETFTCSRCSDTFTSDRYRAFLDHCLNHGKSNDQTKEKTIRTTPVKSRNESKAEQNAEILRQKEVALGNLSTDNNSDLSERSSEVLQGNSNTGNNSDLSERSSEVIQGNSNTVNNPDLSVKQVVKSYACGICSKSFAEEETFLKHLRLHEIEDEMIKLSDSQHAFHQSNGNEIGQAVVMQKEIQNLHEQMKVNCDLVLQNRDLRNVKDGVMLATINTSNERALQENVITQSNDEVQNTSEQLNTDCDPKVPSGNFHEETDETILTAKKHQISDRENTIEEKNTTKSKSEVQNTSEKLKTNCDQELHNHNLHKEKDEIIPSTEKFEINDKSNAIEEENITISSSKIQNVSERVNRNCDLVLSDKSGKTAYICDICSVALFDCKVFVRHYNQHKTENSETAAPEIQQTSDTSKLSTQHGINRIDHITGNIQTFPEPLNTSQKILESDFDRNILKNEIAVREDLPEYSKLHIELNENAELMQVTDVSIKSNGGKNNVEQLEIARNIIQNTPKHLDPIDNISVVSQERNHETDSGILSESGISEGNYRLHRKEAETSSFGQSNGNIPPIHQSGRNENHIERDIRKQNENTTRSSSQRSNLEILAEASQMLSDIDEENGELAAEANPQLNNAHEDVRSDAPTYSMESGDDGDGEVQITYEKIIKCQSFQQTTTRELLPQGNQYMVTVITKSVTSALPGAPHTHHPLAPRFNASHAHHSQTPRSDTLHTHHSQSPNSNTNCIHHSQAPNSNTPLIHHSEASSSNSLRLQHSQAPSTTAPRISVRFPRRIAPKPAFQTPNQSIAGNDHSLTAYDRASLTQPDRELNTPNTPVNSGTVTKTEERADILKLHYADSGGFVTRVSTPNNRPASNAGEVNFTQNIRNSFNAFTPSFPNYNSRYSNDPLPIYTTRGISGNSGLGAPSKAIMNPLNIGRPSETYPNFHQLANPFAHPSPPNRTCGDNIRYEQLKIPNGSHIFPNYAINRASSTGLLSKRNAQLALSHANQGNINPKLFPRLNSALTSLQEAQNASENNGTFQSSSENSMTSVDHAFRSYSTIDRNKIFLSQKSMHDKQHPRESQSTPFPLATGPPNEKDGSFRLFSESYDSAASNKKNQIISDKINNAIDRPEANDDYSLRSYATVDRDKIFLSDRSRHDNECATKSERMPFPYAIGLPNGTGRSFSGSSLVPPAADSKNNHSFSERTNNTTDYSDTDDDFKIVTDSDSDNEGLTGMQPTFNAHTRFCPTCKLGIPYEEYSNHMRMHESETRVTCNKRDTKKLGKKKNKEFVCVKCNQTFESCTDYEIHTSKHMNEEESQTIPSEAETQPPTEKKRPYECKWCNKTYKLKYRLEEHEKTHQSNYSKCEMCKKHFLWKSESSAIYTLNDICKKCESVLLTYLRKNKTRPIITNNVQGNEFQSDKECSSSKNISTVGCEANDEDKYKESTGSEIQTMKCEDSESNEVQIIKEILGNHKMKRKIDDCDEQNSLKAESSKRKYGRNKAADNGKDRQNNNAEMRKELIAEVNAIKNGSCCKKSDDCRQRKIKNIDETGNRDKLVNSNESCTDIDVEYEERDTSAETDTEMAHQDSDETEDCSKSKNETSDRTSEPEQGSSSKRQKCNEEFCKKSKSSEKPDGKSESTEIEDACSPEGKPSLKLCFSRYNNQYRLTNSSIPLNTFTCKYCPAEFRSRWAFIKHTREHTGSEHFLCNICDHRVVSRSSLQKHIRSNHPEVKN